MSPEEEDRSNGGGSAVIWVVLIIIVAVVAWLVFARGGSSKGTNINVQLPTTSSTTNSGT
jgi:hypothetical protein